jgi:hypothetical protein
VKGGLKKMKREVMRRLKYVALVLVVIGGLNWGLYGLFDLDLIALLLGTGVLAQLIYTLVGVGALWIAIYYLFLRKHKK